jgi:hypothetical protein
MIQQIVCGGPLPGAGAQIAHSTIIDAWGDVRSMRAPGTPGPTSRRRRRWALFIAAALNWSAAVFLLGLRAWEVWALILLILYGAWALRRA